MLAAGANENDPDALMRNMEVSMKAAFGAVAPSKPLLQAVIRDGVPAAEIEWCRLEYEKANRNQLIWRPENRQRISMILATLVNKLQVIANTAISSKGAGLLALVLAPKDKVHEIYLSLEDMIRGNKATAKRDRREGWVKLTLGLLSTSRDGAGKRKMMRAGVNIVVATPDRLAKCLGTMEDFTPEHPLCVVLDRADKLVETPNFAAHWDTVKKLGGKVQRDFKMVVAAEQAFDYSALL